MALQLLSLKSNFNKVVTMMAARDIHRENGPGKKSMANSQFANGLEKSSKEHAEVEVLFQKLDNRLYAFLLKNGEMFWAQVVV